MRQSLFAATVVALLLAFSGTTVGQEASPDVNASASAAPLEVEPVSEPLPVVHYWDEWAEHKAASRGRVALTLNNVKNDRKKRALFYRQAVAAHRDELTWLSHHQPEDCYADEYEQWRSAVEGLEANQKTALRLAKGNTSRLKRAAKQRRAPLRQLDKALSNVADCSLSQLDADDGRPPGEPFVGRWKSADNFVQPDGFHNSSRLTLTVEDDGRYLLRDSNGGICRSNGYGYVPVTVAGEWQSLSEQPSVLVTTAKRMHCYPRDGRPRQRLPAAGSFERHYDAAHDVLYADRWGYCWWRNKGGSRSDCIDFWRGTPPEPATTVVAEEADAPEETAPAMPAGSDE